MSTRAFGRTGITAALAGLLLAGFSAAQADDAPFGNPEDVDFAQKLWQ